MAYFYGNETNHWWGYGNVTTSNQSGSVTRVTLTAGMQARGWGFDISYVDATATVNGQSATTYDNDFYSPTGGYAAVDMVTKTLDITRDHSAKTINVSIRVVNSSSYMDGTSTASSTVTIPARASYSVTYNANGGSGAPVSQTKWHDETLTLSTTKPTRSGYSFQGWATSSGGSVAYASGAAYKANAAVTLYAVWAASSWTVAYNANGGTSTPSSQTKNYNVDLTLAGAISHNNTSVSYTVTYDANGGSSTGASNNKQTATTTTTWTFVNWKSSADNKTYAAKGKYSLNAATTMTAQWSTSSSGGTVTLPTPTRAGHTFNGWYNGSTRVGGAGGSYRPKANITLKASWTIQTWTVQYDANFGAGAPSAQTKTYGQTLKLSSTQPRRSGYTFLGWATASDGTGTAYSPNGNYTTNAAATLYAVWVAVQVTSVTGYRCESDGTKADGGTYGHIVATCKALGTIAGTLTATATANGTEVTSSLSPTSGSKTATYDLTITPTGTFGEYDASTSITVMVTATLSVSYGGSTRSVSAQRVMVIPKPFRIMDFVHGTAYDGFTEGAAIGSVATLVGRFEVALQTVFRKTVQLITNTENEGGYFRVSTPSGAKVRFGIGEGGINHGIWSDVLSRWLIHSDGTDTIVGGWLRLATDSTIKTALAIKDDRLDRDGSVSSEVWSMVNEFRDKDGERFGGLQAFQTTSGVNGVRLQVFAENDSGTQINNVIDVRIDRSGNKAYLVSDPANFRSAIGAAYTNADGAINTLASTSAQQWYIRGKINNSSNTARNGHYTWLVMDNGGISDLDATSSANIWRMSGWVSLYNNTSGSNGTITLSAAVTNFSWLDIWVVDNNKGNPECVRIPTRNANTTSTVYHTEAVTGGYTMLIRRTKYAISGTTMTPSAGNYMQDSSNTWTRGTDGTNYLYVTRVIGYY